jgi:hypothetical protein
MVFKPDDSSLTQRFAGYEAKKAILIYSERDFKCSKI